jgi:hypothetical protein
LEYGLLSRAVQGLKAHGLLVGDNLLEHLSPLGWEHINLTHRRLRLAAEPAGGITEISAPPTLSRFLTYDFSVS